MDASVHQWFGKDKSFLHAAIDDAAGQIVGAYCDSQGSVIKYKKKIYAPYKNDKRINLPAKTEVVILKAYDDELFIQGDKHIYSALEAPCQPFVANRSSALHHP